MTDSSLNSYDEIFTINLVDQTEAQQVLPGAQSVDEGGSLIFSSGEGNAHYGQ